MNILKLLYPPRNKCILCGIKDLKPLCNICSASIEFIHERQCLKCGKGLSDSYDKNICPDCMERSYSFLYGYSCFYYKGSGKELIHKLKYEGMTEIAPILARYMANKARDENIRTDIIVPVPIFASKLKKRGFNQTMLIGEKLSGMLGIPVWDCLIRVRDTKEQYGMNRQQRRLNVLDAFSLNKLYDVDSRSVLLIDDIYTTGSTVDECSRVLMREGASRVIVLTAASGVNT